ncbi:hypothetical protein IJ596_00060, partial [bacterium]|nr:hypothetical protein [bacterium]
MIISSLSLVSNISYYPQNNKISAPSLIYKNLQPLERDLVSFTSGKSIKDDLYAQHAKSINKYKVEANQYVAALASIADDLKGYGVSFDIDSAKANAVKSTDRVIEKVESSKSFDIRDKIRATIYVKNPYDKNFIVNTFLPKMGDYGYVLDNKDGKPDIDFRLNGFNGPTKSGYEDIQMRFVKS